MTFSFTPRRARAASLLLAAFLGLASCLPPGLSLTTGSLVIRIADGQPGARTLVPAIDMNVASYVVSGTGPGGAAFSVTVTGATATIPALKVGSWTVSVDGKNAAGTFIGHGGSTVQVTGGTTVTLNMAVTPIAGFGTLELTVTWPAASVASPVITATLVPATGSATPLGFSAPASGSSTYTNTVVLNGYYTLDLQLLDGTALVAGAVEVVRIVAGQTTSGTFAFTSLNQSRGTLTVNITPQLQNPIVVTLSGQPAADTGVGIPFTITGSVPAGTGTVTYVWYVNGASTATGASLTLNTAAAPLEAGTWRIDVVAFTTDGLRAGSTSATVNVFTTSSVTVAWNPNTESDLASYKLYLGAASGAYTASTDVGLVTAYPLAGLLSGHTYYAAVTAINGSGLESTKSTELSFTAP